MVLNASIHENNQTVIGQQKNVQEQVHIVKLAVLHFSTNDITLIYIQIVDKNVVPVLQARDKFKTLHKDLSA